jgi:transcriptional regulator CtsR
MKRKGIFKLSGVLLFVFLAACGREGGDTGTSLSASGVSAPVRSQGASVTGNTLTSKVPFSQEGFEQSRASEAVLAGTLTSLMVAPFHYAPPPTLISISGGLNLLTPSFQAQAQLAPESLAPALIANFAGLGDDNRSIPPDTMGAVGPSHLLSTLNGGVGVFNKTTGAKLSQVTLQGFWASLGTGAGQPANFVYDPKALYDQHSDRFVVVSLGGTAAPNSWMLVAVSATSDPNGTWHKYAIDADLNNGVQDNNWADFPGLGLDNANLYITANMFPTTSGSIYSKIWVIPKGQLLAGTNPITWTEFVDPPGTGFSIQPAHVYGNSSAEYLVHEGYYFGGTPPRRGVRISKIDFPSSTPTWTDMGWIEVNPYSTDGLPEAPQLGISQLIETNDTRLLNAVFRNGTLWTTHTVADNTNARTQIAWYQLDPAAASLTAFGAPIQQGRISDPSRFYYYPSIAVNSAGDAAIGFSGSSPTVYASAYYTARAASDPPGTMQSVSTLKAGLASYFKDYGSGRNRWGDFSATCVDPTDDLTFWTLQEYAATPANTWATWWGSFSLPPSSLPVAPANLSATPVSASQINLTWTDQSTNETGFEIERKTGAVGTYAQIGTTAANITTYSDSGRAEGTTYFYRVRAANGTGNSAYSNEASATTSASLPVAPANLSATAFSSSQINLSWTDQSTNETGFQIERKTGAGGTYALIGTRPANDTSEGDGGLAGGATYFYRVRAVNGAGNSAYSNEASATTPLHEVPANLSATAVSSTTIYLTWTYQSANQTGFQIERKTGAGGTYALIVTVASNATTYIDTGRTEGTTYFYRVRAVVGTGNYSAYSNEASATTSSSLPAAPVNLSAAAVSPSQINLSWTDQSGNETGFQIERKTGAGGTYALIVTKAANSTTYSDSGVAEGTAYFYRVRAANGAGNSAYSNEASATTSASLPAAPVNLSAAAASVSQINLSWTDQSLNETGFQVERKTGAGGTYALIGMRPANDTSYSDSGLVEGTPYFYRVRAVNGAGNSAYSNEASATTPASVSPPVAPANLSATPVSSSQINLSWTDQSGNETGFQIERKTGAGGTYALIVTTAANATAYSDSGLVEGATYFYRVRAANGAGNSAYSNESSATTSASLPAAPANLSATAVSASQINLTWTDQSTNETGFQIERKTGAGGSYAQIGTAAANATAYSDSGVAEGTTYFYRVWAVNGTVNSAESNEANATTPSSGTGSSGGGGGGGCSISPEGKLKGESPLGTMLVLLSPGFLLVVRKTLHRLQILP